jgi:predicted porin
VYEEGLWQHRYVSTVYADGYGFDDSADYGVALKGVFMEGLVKYFASLVNGGGYSNPDKTDALDYGVRLTVSPLEGLDISGHYRDGKRGRKTLANPNADDHTLWQGLISYGIGQARIGAGYIDNTVTTVAGAETQNTGFDLWAWYNFSPEYGAFGRYDHKKQTVTGNNTDEKLDRFIVGLEYLYSKTLRFSAVYDHTNVANSGNTPGTTKETDKYGLYSQFAF